MNLLKSYILFVLLFFVFWFTKANAQSGNSISESFIINGKVVGKNSGAIMLAYPDTSGQKLILDSAAILNGNFQFRGKVGLPLPARLYIKGSDHRYSDQNKNFYLENSLIDIVVYADSIRTSKVTGSNANDDMDSIEVLMVPYYETFGALRKVRSFAAKQNLPSLLKSIDNIYEELPAAQRKLIVEYALAHPNSYAITSKVSMNFTNNQTELSKLKKVYEHFSSGVKQSIGGREIAALIQRIERVQVGKKAPEFSLPNENGRVVALSSFKGKYVLIDFWASWCVPCRAESPFLVKAYEKFKNRNFTIISVSLDIEKDKQKWLDAIKNDKMQWTQLCSLKGYEEEGVHRLYSVQGIPDNFLISPEGKILARGLRGNELDEKLSSIIKK